MTCIQRVTIVMFVLTATLAMGVGEERYRGGAFDGYGEGLLLQSDSLEIGNRFSGGSYDGSDEGLFLQSSARELASRFSGGAFDGYGDNLAADQPSPLLSDSDSDSLVDWWELRYADDLATLHGFADLDRDGATDLHELVADTNPTNAASVFRITAVTPTNPISVTFTCTDSRNYSLETSVSLATGTWSSVDGQINVAGDADGSMSLIDTNNALFRAYRVLVIKP